MKKIDKDKYYVCRFRDGKKQNALIYIKGCLIPERAEDWERAEHLEHQMWNAFRLIELYYEIEQEQTVYGNFLLSIRECESGFLRYITWEEKKEL